MTECMTCGCRGPLLWRVPHANPANVRVSLLAEYDSTPWPDEPLPLLPDTFICANCLAAQSAKEPR